MASLTSPCRAYDDGFVGNAICFAFGEYNPESVVPKGFAHPEAMEMVIVDVNPEADFSR
jgi:hypothetical protein